MAVAVSALMQKSITRRMLEAKNNDARETLSEPRCHHVITYSSSILMYESFIRTNLDRIVSARQALPSYDPAHAHEKERAG